MTFIRFFNQIKFVPLCTKCKHFLITEPVTTAENILATSRCMKTIYKCSDTDTYKYEYTYIVRSDEKMCGPKGTSFEPLPKIK
jgi:hypothetical protein